MRRTMVQVLTVVSGQTTKCWDSGTLSAAAASTKKVGFNNGFMIPYMVARSIPILRGSNWLMS